MACSCRESRTELALAIVSDRDIEEQEWTPYEVRAIPRFDRQCREAQNLGAIDQVAGGQLPFVSRQETRHASIGNFVGR